MNWRRPFHYLGAALILLGLGAIANLRASGFGRASDATNAARDAAAPELAASGVNAFSSGREENLDFAFYEDFLRNRSRRDGGFIADKTGQWSKGSPNLKRGAGETPDLQRVAEAETILATPNPIHDGGLIGAGGGESLPTGDIVGDALFGVPSLDLPGLIPGEFGPDATPVSEVPIPPAAILFSSAIAGLAFAMRNRKG